MEIVLGWNEMFRKQRFCHIITFEAIELMIKCQNSSSSCVLREILINSPMFVKAIAHTLIPLLMTLRGIYCFSVDRTLNANILSSIEVNLDGAKFSLVLVDR